MPSDFDASGDIAAAVDFAACMVFFDFDVEGGNFGSSLKKASCIIFLFD